MLKFKQLVATLFLFISFISSASETITMTQQQLLSLMAAPKSEPFVVLDVRTEQEFNQGHIQGAINVSHDQIADKLASLTQHKDATVIVHCRSGRRAGIAEAILAENGFSKLRHLQGDMNGWVDANLPLVQK